MRFLSMSVIALAVTVQGSCAATVRGDALGGAGGPGWQDRSGGGTYSLEEEAGFNVLDEVVFDPDTGALSLLGHHDAALAGPRIPYLQHLAAFLEHPAPMLSLKWTSQSHREVDSFMKNNVHVRWGRVLDREGQVTPDGRCLLPALGVFPTEEGRPPGRLGARTVLDPEGQVVVKSVEGGSPAESAGLNEGDVILFADNLQPCHPRHLEWIIRRAGAGRRIKIQVSRPDGLANLEAALETAEGDPWDHFQNFDVVSALFRIAGQQEQAVAADRLNWMQRLNKAGPSKHLVIALIFALDLMDRLNELQEKCHQGTLTEAQCIDSMMRSMCEKIDRIFGVPGGAGLRRFDEEMSSSGESGAAFDAAFQAVTNALPPVLDRIIADAISRRGTLIIRPEWIEAAYGVKFEVTTWTNDLDPASPLAGVMYRADVLLKSLQHLPALEQRIPRYRTLVGYDRDGPGKGMTRGTWRLWFSVDHVSASESPDGSTLRLRNAKMKISAREIDGEGEDLPAGIGGYEELLTSLYDDLEREFPVFHELRECAKLAEAARWLRTRQPGFALPIAGRVSASLPETTPGVYYIHVRNNPGNPEMPFEGIFIAAGGVDLRTPVRELPHDDSVVGLRGDEAVKPLVYDNTELRRILGRKIEVPAFRTHACVRPTKGAKSGREFEEALTILVKAEGDPVEHDHVRRRLEEGRKVASALEAIERQMFALTLKGEDRAKEFEQLGESLAEGRDQFAQASLSIVRNALNDYAGSLKEAGAGELAGRKVEGLAVAGEALEEFRARLDRIQTGLKAADAPTRLEALKSLSELATDLGQEHPSLSKVLGPLSAVKNKVERLRDVAELGRSLWTLGTGTMRIQALGEDDEAEFRRLNDLILPIHKRLSDRLDGIRKDPLIARRLSESTDR